MIWRTDAGNLRGEATNRRGGRNRRYCGNIHGACGYEGVNPFDKYSGAEKRYHGRGAGYWL